MGLSGRLENISSKLPMKTLEFKGRPSVTGSIREGSADIVTFELGLKVIMELGQQAQMRWGWAESPCFDPDVSKPNCMRFKHSSISHRSKL